MKVGDLIRWKYADGADEEDIGVVTHVHDDELRGIDALFSDGEHCVDPSDYEVINEAG